MGKPQLIIAHDGQYASARVSEREIVRFGSTVIPPADLILLGLQDTVDVVVRAHESAIESLVLQAEARAGEFGADCFLLGRERRKSLPEQYGFEIVSAETRAYVKRPSQ